MAQHLHLKPSQCERITPAGTEHDLMFQKHELKLFQELQEKHSIL